MRCKPAEGAEVAGYRLERRLGEGGFGQVFLARQGERLCALKFIRLEGGGAWGWRELAVLAHLRHPNVVRLLGHVVWPQKEPEYLVLLLEYVEGLPLYEWARSENPTAQQVGRLVLRLAQALAALHQQGVLHCDLKGSNVLVRSEEPVLVDFGSAYWAGAPRVTGSILAPCPLHYRSPESVRFLLHASRAPGECYRYTVADDLYALGVVLYVLLTDSLPFDGPEQAMLAEVVGHVPKAPHVINGRVPQLLSELCMHLLEKQPGARPASAAELCRRLEVALQTTEATWDLPLCQGWSQDESTAEDILLPAEVGAQWLKRRVRQQPRRGKRHTQAA